MKQKKTKVEKKQKQQIKELKKMKLNIDTSFSYTSYHLMKVISQITPWPIMQAVKAQTRRNRKKKENTGQSGKGQNKKGEGIFRDDTKTHQKDDKKREYKEKTEGGKVWKRNDWKNRRQGLQKVNKVSGFLYRIIKKPKNYEALKGTQKHE